MKIETQVKQTLRKINLNKKQKVLVAVSGGKDSSVVTYLLKKFGYNPKISEKIFGSKTLKKKQRVLDIEAIHINLRMGKYSEDCLKAVEKLCSDLKIKLYVYDIKKEMGSSMCYLRSSVQAKKNLKNCAICGVIKKWILNKEARKLKVDKIATGHHLDDEIQTFILNILKGSPELSANSGAITKNISDKKFIPRIKPLYYVLEEDIKKYSLAKKLPVVYEKCPCAIDSYRIQVREFLKTLSRKEKENIMKNAEQISQKLERNKSKINYCEICGEPSRREICKVCEMIGV